MPPRSRLSSSGGFPASAGWRKLTSVEQALGAPVDPGGIGTTGTGFDLDTGRATVVCAAHTAQVDGYQEQLLRWTALLTDLYDDFDPDLDLLEVGADLVTFPHGTVEAGVWVGVLDHLTVDGSLAGACAGVRQAGAATDQASLIGAGASSNTNNLGLIDELHALIQWSDDGTNYPTQILTRALIEGTARLDDGSAGAGQVMRAATLASWRLAFGVFHGSTDSLAGTTLAFDVYHRRLRRSTGPFP